MNATIAMMMPGVTELLIIAAVILMLFGAKKIPEMAKGVATAIREVKGAVKPINDEIKDIKKELN